MKKNERMKRSSHYSQIWIELFLFTYNVSISFDKRIHLVQETYQENKNSRLGLIESDHKQ